MDESPDDARAPFRGLWVGIFRLGGIGVYVDPTALLAVAVLAIVVGAPLVLLSILVGSVLLHELGHAVIARRRGLAVTGIYLHVIAVARVERGRPLDELFVALAGPLANALVAVLLLAIPLANGSLPEARLAAWLSNPYWAAVGCNVLMALANLAPVLPADGGRAIRALLRLRYPPAAVHTVSSVVNVCCGVALVALSVLPAPPVDSRILFGSGLAVCLFGWREARRAASGRF